MNKGWLYVFAAGMIEVLWVIGLKYSESWYEWAATIILLCLSFYVLIKASESIPVATTYAVFTGIGTAGTTVVGMLVFGDEFSWLKILFIGLLLVGIIGLKLITPEEEAV